MEIPANIISSQAKLSAIAGIMFFSPFIKDSAQSNPTFSDYEKDFIASYINIGYTNLFLLGIVLVAEMTSLFLVSSLLYQISQVGCIMIYIISILSLFACVLDISMRRKDESIIQKIQNKSEVIKAYIPGLNFFMRYKLPDYSRPYRRLKESILMRCVFIICTMLFGPLIGMGVLVFIVSRLILLMMNIDVIPMGMKRALNSMFACNPGEATAYLSSSTIAKLKSRQYDDVLLEEKKKYYQGQSLSVNIVLQYVLFFVILFLLYRNIDLSLHHVLIFVAFLLWIIRVMIFYLNKKTLIKIPILSEIVSLVF